MPSNHGTLTGDRLRLEPWRKEDLHDLHRIWSDPEVIWWGASESLEETVSLLLDRVEQNRTLLPRALGWFKIIEAVTGEVVGNAMLFFAAWSDQPTLGYHIRRDRWGRGYAREASSILLHHACAESGWEVIDAIVVPDNHSSQRVMQKLGFVKTGHAEYKGWLHDTFRRRC